MMASLSRSMCISFNLCSIAGQTRTTASWEEALLIMGHSAAITSLPGKEARLYMGNLLRKRGILPYSTLLMATPMTARSGGQQMAKQEENLNTIWKSSTACEYTAPIEEQLPSQLMKTAWKPGTSFLATLTLPTPPTYQRVRRPTQISRRKMESRMNCQLLRPSHAKRSPYVSCPIILQVKTGNRHYSSLFV